MTDGLASRFRGLIPEESTRQPTPLAAGAAFAVSGLVGLVVWSMFWLPLGPLSFSPALSTQLALVGDGLALGGSRVARVALLAVCSYWILRWVARLAPAEGGMLPSSSSSGGGGSWLHPAGATSLLPVLAWLILGAVLLRQGLGRMSGSRYSVPDMSDHEKTQDQPIMDGATEATEQEKQAGREEQREMDAQVGDKN